jgi:hypothetical protein
VLREFGPEVEVHLGFDLLEPLEIGFHLVVTLEFDLLEVLALGARLGRWHLAVVHLLECFQLDLATQE